MVLQKLFNLEYYNHFLLTAFTLAYDFCKRLIMSIVFSTTHAPMFFQSFDTDTNILKEKVTWHQGNT